MPDSQNSEAFKLPIGILWSILNRKSTSPLSTRGAYEAITQRFLPKKFSLDHALKDRKTGEIIQHTPQEESLIRQGLFNINIMTTETGLVVTAVIIEEIYPALANELRTFFSAAEAVKAKGSVIELPPTEPRYIYFPLDEKTIEGKSSILEFIDRKSGKQFNGLFVTVD